MQGLKVLVIGMAVAIVVMITIIITTMANRAIQGVDTLPSFAAQKIAVPAGARVVGTSVGEGRLIVHLELEDGSSRLLAIDLASGRELGGIDLRAAP